MLTRMIQKSEKKKKMMMSRTVETTVGIMSLSIYGFG